MTRRLAVRSAVAAVLLSLAVAGVGSMRRDRGWTDEDLAVIASLALPANGLRPPPSPSNRVADDERAARLGRDLFFDEGLSSNGLVSCGTCHRPELAFADDRARSSGVGLASRNTPSLAGAAWSPWLAWDGRRDSAWAQALAPLESAAEHGLSRVGVARRVAHRWRAGYEPLFGALPPLHDRARFPESASPLGTTEEARAWEAMAPEDREAVDEVFANAGKALEAWERRLELRPSRFDLWARDLLAGREEAGHRLGEDEIAGLRLFLGKGRCTQCHVGPLLTNHEFHSLGLAPGPGEPVLEGRSHGVIEALRDPFNCLGAHSDADPGACEELLYAKTAGEELVGAMKVPSLRNVSRTAPYMHDGRFATLEEVLAHYSEAPEPPAGHSDLEPLDLSAAETRRIAAFLRTLESELEAPAGLEPPARAVVAP